MIKTWFTSDTHYGHRNIIKYCNRPFANVDEMNEAMISNWNSVVGVNDHVYHIGDVTFEKDKAKGAAMLSRLRGKKFIVWGNHDRGMQDVITDAGFTDCGSMHTVHIELEGAKYQRAVLCHYAMRVWDRSHFGDWNLYGHSHGTLLDDPHSLGCDVGVDAWNFTPVNMDQLQAHMDKKLFTPIDHHGQRYKDGL